MDKAQKELIKTYYRKRNIVVKQEDPLNPKNHFRPYEYSVIALKNNLINKDNFHYIDMVEAVINNPEIVKYIDNMNIFNDLAVSSILRKQPKLIEYFKDRLDNIDNNNFIIRILMKQPQLMEYFKDRFEDDMLDNSSIENIVELILKQPQLTKYLKYRLHEISDNYVADILKEHPQLIEYFKDLSHKININYVADIVKEHPQLKKYFEDHPKIDQLEKQHKDHG